MDRGKPSLIMSMSIALAIASSCSFAGTVTAPCTSDLKPIRTVPPRLPVETEVGYEGKALVAIVVNRNGSVSDASIASNNLRAVSGRDPRTFDGALLAAVKQWKFRAQQRACRKDVTIELKFSE